jgi:YegS/Rv2252/BmrU family lipid kinase
MKEKRAHIIFNPSAGDTEQSQLQLAQIVEICRSLRLVTSTTLVGPGIDIADNANLAAHRGAHYIVASGGDNTIDMVARGLIGTRAKLVIVPTGTRNNIAHSLNIPLELEPATRLIREGTSVRVDMGRVRSSDREVYFLELVSIGLTAAMFPALDEAQKGNLSRLGDLLGTFITHPASLFTLNLDRGRQKLQVQALTMAVLNMPYLGANFQLADDVDFHDGLLDMFLYADLGKLDLLTHAVQVARGFADDPRVRHLRIKRVDVTTEPPLPVMVDGEIFEAKRLEIRRMPRALRVMVPKTI